MEKTLYVVIKDGQRVSNPLPKEIAESQVVEKNKQLLESKSDESKYELKEFILG